MYGVLVQASASVGWCARQHNSKAALTTMAELGQWHALMVPKCNKNLNKENSSLNY